jgi:hypothetical protein
MAEDTPGAVKSRGANPEVGEFEAGSSRRASRPQDEAELPVEHKVEDDGDQTLSSIHLGQNQSGDVRGGAIEFPEGGAPLPSEPVAPTTGTRPWPVLASPSGGGAQPATSGDDTTGDLFAAQPVAAAPGAGVAAAGAGSAGAGAAVASTLGLGAVPGRIVSGAGHGPVVSQAAETASEAVTETPTAPAADTTASTPDLSVENASGFEDSPVALGIASALTDTDGSETLSITVSGVPEGAVLSAGTDNGDGTWTLTPDQLAGLTITPPPNSDADFQLTVTATSTEANGGATASTSTTLDVVVDPVADAPMLTVQNASGAEDSAIALNVAAALTDTDGSETLAVTVAGVPNGAALSAGTDNGDGSWTLTPDQLAGLTITPPANSDQDFQLTVTATSTEGDGGFASTTATLDVVVDPVADAPSLAVQNAGGAEDSSIALNIASALTDIDGSETLSVTVSGVPEGAALSTGTDNGDGSWTLTPDQLAGLAITPPANSDQDFQLTVTATSTEGDGGGTASTSATLDVVVNPVADTPSLVVQNAAGAEDSAIALNIASALTDTDGSETLAITIGGVPNGATLSAGTDNGDGSWTLTPDQLAGLTITPPENFNGSFELAVTATSSEQDGGSANSSSILTVDVTPVADAAALSTSDAAGSEDTAIPLSIDVSSVDPISSVVVSGMPEGATLSAGADNGDGSWTLSAADLDGLTITPPANSNVDFTLGVAVTTSDGGDTATVNSTIDVDVVGVADAPTLTATLGEGRVSYVGGVQNDFVDDGSQTHTGTGGDDTFVVERDLRMNENFQMGNGDDTVIIEGDTSQGHNFNLGPGDDSVTFNGDIKGNTAVDGGSGNDVIYLGKDASSYQLRNFTNHHGHINTQIVDLDTGQMITANNVEAIAFGDRSVVGNSDIVDFDSGGAGTMQVTYDLDIASSLTDTDGSESLGIMVSGLPEGAALSAGTDNGDGSWTLAAGDLDGLQLTITGDQAGQALNLNVVATSVENDGDSTSVSTIVSSAGTTVDTTAEGATLEAANVTGAEDSAIGLDITAALNDTDGSETLSITVSGVPDGPVGRDRQRRRQLDLDPRSARRADDHAAGELRCRFRADRHRHLDRSQWRRYREHVDEFRCGGHPRGRRAEPRRAECRGRRGQRDRAQYRLGADGYGRLGEPVDQRFRRTRGRGAVRRHRQWRRQLDADG